MKKKKIENRDVEFLFRDFGVCFLLYTYMEKIYKYYSCFFKFLNNLERKKEKKREKATMPNEPLLIQFCWEQAFIMVSGIIYTGNLHAILCC